jgi:hypothetical protein
VIVRLGDRSQVRCVRQFIDVDNERFRVIQQMPDHGRPDETCASRDEYDSSLEAHVQDPVRRSCIKLRWIPNRY